MELPGQQGNLLMRSGSHWVGLLCITILDISCLKVCLSLFWDLDHSLPVAQFLTYRMGVVRTKALTILMLPDAVSMEPASRSQVVTSLSSGWFCN